MKGGQLVDRLEMLQSVVSERSKKDGFSVPTMNVVTHSRLLSSGKLPFRSRDRHGSTYHLSLRYRLAQIT